MMSSRDRLLAAINHQEPDRVPVCFWGTIAPLRHLWQTPLERVERLFELGIDDVMGVGMPWVYHPDVEVRVVREASHQPYPLLIKELATPRGTLRMAVKQTADYAWDDPPLVADANWSRAAEHLVKGEEDLERLAYILHDPAAGDLTGFREHAARVREFCAARGVLVTGSVPSPSNFAMNFLGATNMMLKAADDRAFVKELLGSVAEWSKRTLEMVLEVGVDTVQFSGIYEGTAFWSPADYEDLFAPSLGPLVEMAHQAGVKFHYFSDAQIMGYLETWREMGVDILSYLNPPPMGDADLGEIKQRVGERICLWGGINSPITIERGTQEEVRQAVVDAIRAAAPGGGFVLASADAIMVEEAYDNLMTMVRTCHEFGRYPIAL